MINRSAVVLSPKQPYIDWAEGLDDSGISPSELNDKSVYLLPEYDDDDEAMEMLTRAYGALFECELENWHLVMDDWPKNRTFAMFREWFDIQMHGVIHDLSGDPIVTYGV